jgi:Fic-DOC domain mobile mystery protein B
MGPELSYGYGQTPISAEEMEGLLIKTISTKAELNEFEQNNIELAVEWSMKQNFQEKKILTIDFILEVHRRMFNRTWEWAGKIRRTNKNIGVDKYYILSELNVLMEDCRYWIAHQSFPEDEIAVRFKHRLVSIHPFPNGNGRHSRMCADIVISHVFNRNVFSWGGFDLAAPGVMRKKYLAALYAADQGDIQPLVLFSRS